MDEEDNIFVLDRDFEYLLASTLSNRRILEIINNCRSRRNIEPLSTLNSRLTANNIGSHWWDKTKSFLNQTIAQEHREHYQADKMEIKAILNRIALSVINQGHNVSDSATLRKSQLLQKEGKPLVGRVVGEMLTKREIQRMPMLVEALQRVVSIAKQE